MKTASPLNIVFNGFLSVVFLATMVVVPQPASANAVRAMEEIQLLKGDIESIAVKGLQKVSITDPEIADISDANEEEVLVLAKSTGQTILFVWESTGKRTIVIRVIDEDLSLLSSRVTAIIEKGGLGKGIRVEESDLEGKVVVSGAVPEARLDRLEDLLAPFGDKIINIVRAEEIEDLVQIDMQITELNSTLRKELGFDWFTGGTDNGTLQLDYNENFPTGLDGVKDWLKIGSFNRGADSALVARLNALVEEGKAEILSKPRLVVANGKEASFLVGGEIPIRTTTSNATGGSVQEDVEFKEYGVNLIMTPVIRKGKVDLQLNVEISEIDDTTVTSSGDAAFLTRTAQTQLFLEDGETIVLAGLIRRNEGVTTRKVPFLGDIPVLGMLFRSKKTPTTNRETEVIISLTPKIMRDKPVDGFDEDSLTTVGADTRQPMVNKSNPMNDNSPMMNEHLGVTSVDTSSDYIAPSVKAEMNPEMRDGLVAPTYQEMPLISKPVSVVSQSAVPAIMGPYVKSVQLKISEAISYPYEAQKNGWEGTTKLTLRILRNGTLDDIVLKETSGYAIFDQDAMNTARILSPYDVFPSDLDLEEIVVTVPIVYSLNSFLQNVVNRQ